MRDKEIMKQIEEYYYLNHGNDEQGQFISNVEGMKEDIYDWCVFPYLERIKQFEEAVVEHALESMHKHNSWLLEKTGLVEKFNQRGEELHRQGTRGR